MASHATRRRVDLRPSLSCWHHLLPPALPHLAGKQLSQAALQARGREHAGLAAELAGVRRELERYAGLPADAEEARALTAAKRAELERLRRKLAEHLDSLA